MSAVRELSSRGRVPVRLIAVLLTGALAFGGVAVSNAAPGEMAGDPATFTQDPTTVADSMMESLRAAIGDDDVFEQLLDSEIEFQIPGHGRVTGPVRAAINRLGGGIVGDEDDDGDDNGENGESGGFAGLPTANAGNIMHIYTNLGIELFSPALPEDDRPAPPDLLAYDVIESDYSPDTPILPVPNPLLLAPGLVDLPDEVTEALDEADLPVDLPAILAAHWGGKLSSVKASDYTMGFRSVGTTELGSNVDTAAREADPDAEEDDPWPFWLPPLTGELALPTDSIDFAGFAMVIEGQTCTLTPSQFVIARTCLAIGTMLGDGITFVNGEGPFDLREDVPLIWDPAPEPVLQVMEMVDEVLGQANEVVDEVTEALDLPDVDDLLDPEDDDDDAEQGSDPVSTILETVGGLLG